MFIGRLLIGVILVPLGFAQVPLPTKSEEKKLSSREWISPDLGHSGEFSAQVGAFEEAWGDST